MTPPPSPDASVTVELLPCPFCGDADDYNPSVSPTFKYAEPGDPEKGTIGNPEAGTVPGGFVIECDKCSGLGPHRETEAEAITAWNTRLSSQPSTAVRYAAVLLAVYADFIRTVPADDLERHPYLPLVEQVAADLLSPSAGAGPDGVREAIRNEIINTPETADFMAGVAIEAVHQHERWGSQYDGGKTPEDWFWLIGYLAQKALRAQNAGDVTKALHHTISTAAALSNWHLAISGAHTLMRPGISDPVAALSDAEGGR